METKSMKTMKKSLWKWVLGVCMLFAGVQSAFALACDGMIYIQAPADWTMVTLEAGGMFPELTKGTSGWYEAKAASVGQGNTFRVNSAGTHYPAQWIDRVSYDIANNESLNTNAFTCADLASGTLYIYEDPTTPGKTVFGSNPPNAKYFFVMIPPDYEDWMSAVPMISLDGGATGKPMTAVDGMCGWYSYVFFNEEPGSNVVLYRDDDEAREDMIGMNGNWEISENATPINLDLVFSMVDSLFFVPDEGQKTNDDGYYYHKDEVDGIEGTCQYTMAAIIYDSDASLHPAFSCYSIGGEGCQYGAQGIAATQAQAAVNACIGVTPGLVNPTLDPSLPQQMKKPTLSAAGKSCFISDDLFNQLFNYTKGVNEKSCYNMPFKRSSDGKWEFDSDYYISEGVKVAGGFYPVESTTDAIILEADPTQTPVSAARTKHLAEGAVFYGPALRELDPVEQIPIIDVYCNGPAWDKGFNCKGLFADGDGTTAQIQSDLKLATPNDCVFGWSCPDKAPAKWPRYVEGTENTSTKADGAIRWTAKENAAGTGGRNQQFCFESHAKFTQKPGLRFNFRGDDDIWVFIDNKLAVDLGGTHLAAPGYVDLDNFEGLSGKLVNGNQYDLDIFFCDRRTTMSNVRIKTNMYIMQKTDIDAKGKKDPADPAVTSYEVCYTKSGDGSCASAMTDSEEEVTYCGDQIKNANLPISFTLVNGNSLSSPVVPGMENVSEAGVYKCGIDLTNVTNPKVNKDAICLGGGRYTLFMTIDGKTKKIATFRKSGEVDVVYADGIAMDTLNNVLGSYSLVKSAMGGEFVPVYVSAVAPSVDNPNTVEIFPTDAIGVEYTLAYDKLMTVYRKTVGADGAEAYTKIPSGEKLTIGLSGVDTLYATVAMADLTAPTTPFTIGVTAREKKQTINFYLPQIAFVSAPDTTGKPLSGMDPTAADFAELWVGSFYDFYLTILKPNDDGTYYTCTECNMTIHMGTAETSPGINFSDAEFTNGFATISVQSTKEYRYDTDPAIHNPGTIVAQYNDYVKAFYTPVYFREPPVPSPRLADIFDAHGAVPSLEFKIPGPYFDMNQEYLDGIGDSVAIYYHRAIHKDSLPSRICFAWDSTSTEEHNPKEEGFSNLEKDTEIHCNVLYTVTADNIDCSNPVEIKGVNGYCSNIVTIGGLTLSKEIKTRGVGRLISYAEFMDKGKTVKQGFPGIITDRIAPVPLSAVVRSQKNSDGELGDFDDLIVTMSEPVKFISSDLSVEKQKSSVDFYLNSAIELAESERFASLTGPTSTVVAAEAAPAATMDSATGTGRIKFLYRRGNVSPHVGDYLRLSGNMTDVIWTDVADVNVPGSDTLRQTADATYFWNSPTSYDEKDRLPSPWVSVTGDAEIAVIENKFASTANAPAGDKVPAVTVTGYRTTMTKAEILADQNGIPGHLVKADMYALINAMEEPLDDVSDVYFYYNVEYFTNLGSYVASKSGKIYCDDSKNDVQYFDGGKCTDAGMDRNYYIGWNMRSDEGRVVGTGAYIVKLESYVKLGDAGKRAKQEETSIWGVKRSPKPVEDYKKEAEK